MNEFFVIFSVLILAEILYVQSSRLKVQAIRTRHQFSVSIITREPSLQVILNCRCIVKSSRNYRNNSIGKLKALIEFLRGLNHFFKLLLAFLCLTNNKLLYFFKLMNSENSPSIFSMSASFLSETSGVSSKPNR